MARSPSPEPARAPLEAAHAELLLDLAAATIDAHFRHAGPTLPDLRSMPRPLRRRRGVFVSLRVGSRLNGCIGDVEATEPLAHAVPRLTLAAAFDDPRLPPLRRDEVARLTVELSLLTPMRRLAVGSTEDLGAALDRESGVFIRSGSRRALLLPQVWGSLPDPADFLDALWHKAGLPPDDWPEDLSVFVFQADHHARRHGSSS